MKRTFTLTFIGLIIIMAFVVPNWTATTTIFGTTYGSLSLSDAGAANYSIPITGTPGTGGVSPRIALTYNNQGGNGLLGLGWSIDGLSTISRGGKSIAQDSLVKDVQLNNEDTYNLDGERLISINGVYGGEETEYRTEQNAMIRLKSFGSVNGSPEKWIAYTKSGLIMEYGYSEDSKIEAQGKTDILFWLVNKVYDTKGNYYTIQYQEDINTGEYYPIQIDYTGNDNAGLSPYASIQFNYELRSDVAVEYLNGSMISRTKRISSINTYYGNILYRSYTPSYDEGNYHSVSLMTSIKECSGNNTCIKQTEEDWNK